MSQQNNDYSAYLFVLMILGIIILAPEAEPYMNSPITPPAGKTWEPVQHPAKPDWKPYKGEPIDNNMDSLLLHYDRSDPGFDMYNNLFSNDDWTGYFNDYGDY